MWYDGNVSTFWKNLLSPSSSFAFWMDMAHSSKMLVNFFQKTIIFVYVEYTYYSECIWCNVNSVMLVLVSGFFVFLLVIVLNEHTNNMNFVCLQADTSTKQV